MSDRLQALARRVRDDPFFLASALSEYASSENLDEPGLAGMLGCGTEQLPELALCRRPHLESFGRDIERITERFSLHPLALAEVVRRADALAAWRDGAGAGWLQAARDRGDTNRMSR